VIFLTILSPLGVMGIIAKGDKPGEISPPVISSTKKNESTCFFNLLEMD
jgi:hypothetical protein